MADAKHCPRCGAELAAGASAEGLCPACLLKMAVGPDADYRREEGPQATTRQVDEIPADAQLER